jgi:hypothetical protein
LPTHGLSFKNHFDDLAEQAQRVEELARTASRTELWEVCMGTLMTNMPVIGNCDEVDIYLANGHTEDSSYMYLYPSKYTLFAAMSEFGKKIALQ